MPESLPSVYKLTVYVVKGEYGFNPMREIQVTPPVPWSHYKFNEMIVEPPSANPAG